MIIFTVYGLLKIRISIFIIERLINNNYYYINPKCQPKYVNHPLQYQTCHLSSQYLFAPFEDEGGGSACNTVL